MYYFLDMIKMEDWFYKFKISKLILIIFYWMKSHMKIF